MAESSSATLQNCRLDITNFDILISIARLAPVINSVRNLTTHLATETTVLCNRDETVKIRNVDDSFAAEMTVASPGTLNTYKFAS